MQKRSLLEYARVVRGRVPLQKSIVLTDSIDASRVGAVPLGGSATLGLATLCLDIRGFTRMSSELDQSDVVRMLNIYFPVTARAVYDHDGIIDKYPGDGLMAHFSLDRDGANRAARVAALLMSLVKSTINPELQSAGLPTVQCGVGMDAGDNCSLANVGIEEHAEIIAVGNSVNRAAKLEKEARPEGIILGEALYNRLQSSNRAACTEIPSSWYYVATRATYKLYRLDWTRLEL